jgi:uncharacterized protein (DUF1015 family)
MPLIKPLRGLRPPPERVLDISAPPYDVVSREEAQAHAAGNPASFFHISRPEIDLGPEVDEHADAVHARGAENLRRFVDAGWLRQDAGESFYVYRQRMGAHVQIGVVAAASLAAYDEGRIRKHELTRPDKEDDRTRHIDALGANDEPVFLTYRASRRIDALVSEASGAQAEYVFVTEDGVAHTFWVVRGALNARLAEAFEEIDRLYIADGHHRSAAASRVRTLRRERGSGAGGHDFFLAVAFPDDQVQILEYNRVVRDLAGRSPEQLIARAGERFEIEPDAGKKPSRLHEFGMYVGGRWYRLRARPGSFPDTPVAILDVSILQENLLAPILGVGDPREDERIQFVGGIRGTAELERRVDSGEFAVAFAMYPTSLQQLMSIADAEAVMPPKSTWFEPKLRSGLILHPFAEPIASKGARSSIPRSSSGSRGRDDARLATGAGAVIHRR